MHVRLLAGCAFVLFIADPSARADTRPSVDSVEFTLETYSTQGATTGCGLSFTGAWTAVNRGMFAISGGYGGLWPPGQQPIAILKIGALELAGQSFRTAPLAYTWIEAKGVPRTARWPVRPAETPHMIMTSKVGDAAVLASALLMASNGFVLGMSVEGRTLDEEVAFPPASPAVIAAIGACLDSLTQAVKHRP